MEANNKPRWKSMFEKYFDLYFQQNHNPSLKTFYIASTQYSYFFVFDFVTPNFILTDISLA